MGSVENLLEANGAGFDLLGLLKLLPLLNSVKALDSVSADSAA